MRDETTELFLSFVKQGHFVDSNEHLEWFYQYLISFYHDQITLEAKQELIEIFERLLTLMKV